jgi:transglutaminase-like putative cysteine protease
MTSAAIRLRPAPPLLTGAGLLLWGWQTGFLPYAVPMALLLELPYKTSWRWSITDREFNNVADISGVVFFLMVVYIFIMNGADGIFAVLSIMPFILYMLILVQRYSQQGTVKLSALFISLRRLETADAEDINRDIDLSLPYLLVCIISASSGNQHMVWFFMSCCLLVASILWSFRPRRYHFSLWVALISLSFLLGYGGQIGILMLHRSIELRMMHLFERYMWRYRDPDRATTAIGTIGRLKQSDSIVLRMDTDRRLKHSLLLREASYSSYGFGVWSNVDTRFDLIDPDITPGNWTLDKHKGNNSVVIATYMIKDTGVIPLPQGSTNIRDSNAIEINRNHYGTVRMEAREGWVRYRALYRPGKIDDPPPNNRDLAIAENYRLDFQRLAREWGLYGKQPLQILQTVKHNFAVNFRYSLTQRNRYPRGKYLHNFLFNDRRGHCEFFATSTVLLLRAAGIPARYAVGYVVDEYSRLEGRYIARARDAHSWALAYVNGGWQVVDTTPSVWGPEEDAESSALEPLLDFVSWVKYRFVRWQSDDRIEEKTSGNYLLWLLVPLVLLLIWRLYGKQRVSRIKSGNERPANTHYPGMDSALYALVRELEQAGYYRKQGETLAAWFARLDEDIKSAGLNDALQLHYRYRFDPESTGSELNNRLSEVVSAILHSGLVHSREKEPS